MKRVTLGSVALLVALALPTVAKATDTNAQATITSGSYAMPSSEIASLVGAAQWNASVEGQATSTSSTLHCYGAVKWKAGVNAVGITLWKEWNHTAWCGYPYKQITSVNGYTDTWTGPVWTVSDVSWTKWADGVHPNTEKHTQSSAVFGEGASCCTVMSETIRVPMAVFANGAWL